MHLTIRHFLLYHPDASISCHHERDSNTPHIAVCLHGSDCGCCCTEDAYEYKKDCSSKRRAPRSIREWYPVLRFTAQDVIDGFSAPSDTHVFSCVPANTVIPCITFFGGPDFDDRRHWGWLFLGDEVRNKEKGLDRQPAVSCRQIFLLQRRVARTARPAPAQDLVSVAQQRYA